MKLNKITKHKSLAMASCFGVLGLLTVALLCPVTGNNASAEEEGPVTRSYEVDGKVYVRPVISVALAPSVDVDVVPKSTGTFSYTTSNLTVSTNNTSGFKVLLNGADGSDLKSTDATNSSVIASTATAATGDAMAANTWGYYLGKTAPTTSSTFNPVATTATEADRVDTATETTNYSLAFGAKINTSLPAGLYTNSVVVSVVANPLEVTSLAGLTFMQDMVPAVCENTASGATKKLIDSRDGNEYWVAKLLDGRCWMTQNLDLNITANGLKATDTNITADWNSQSEYAPTQTSNQVPAAVTNPSQTTTYSWDFGKWVLATPLLTTSCNDQTNIQACTTVGFVDVSDETRFQPGYQAQTGTWKNSDGVTTASTTVAVNCTGWQNNICVSGTYDEHYLIGNYYQYNTATAGTGGTITDADATGSICPKGWQLPTSGTGTFSSTKSGSFAYMLKQYGLATADNAGSVSGTGVDGKSYNIASAPLYFVRSGYIGINTGRLGVAGQYGYDWSSRASSTRYDGAAIPSGYFLHFNATGVYPSNGPSERWLGFPLRCLSTAVD